MKYYVHMTKESPQEPVSEQSTPPPPTNPTHIILLITTIVAVAIASALGGYFIATKIMPPITQIPITPTPTLTATITVTETPSTKACTMEAKICPDGTSVGRTGPNCEFSPCPSIKVIPTPKPNPNGHTFYSTNKGIAFYYGDTMTGAAEKIAIKETDNRVYLYGVSMKPETGQYIEIFTKTKEDSLEQAIKKQFLTGIPEKECYVSLQKSTDPAIVKATIAYPVPTNAEEPAFTFGDTCPENYKESNGMAYFYYDTRMPTRYFYLSIGQYGIPAYTGKMEPMWQDTLMILK